MALPHPLEKLDLLADFPGLLHVNHAEQIREFVDTVLFHPVALCAQVANAQSLTRVDYCGSGCDNGTDSAL